MALSFCQNWPARPVSLLREFDNLKEQLHDLSHYSGGVYIILEVCLFEGVVELVLPNGRSVVPNRKRPEASMRRARIAPWFLVLSFFNWFWNYHIYIVKYLFTVRDDEFKNWKVWERLLLWHAKCSLPVSVLACSSSRLTCQARLHVT